MKKILLSLSVFASLTLSAQTLVNGDFESTMTESSQLPGFFTTAGWGGWLFAPETSSPITGTQSVKLETKVDAGLHAFLGWDVNQTYCGYLSQSIRQTIPTPQNVVLDFDYRYIKTGMDSAYVQVTIIDTMVAGNEDDITLFFNYILVGESTTGLGHATLEMIPTGVAGTANRLVVYAVSSIDGWFNDMTPSVGSTLTLDNVVITNYAASIDNTEKEMSVKVYPIPTNNELNFELDKEILSIQITTLDGKTVINQNVNAFNGVVNVTSLETGVYIYTIISKDGEKFSNSFMKN
jgi:hypothetical protein